MSFDPALLIIGSFVLCMVLVSVYGVYDHNQYLKRNESIVVGFMPLDEYEKIYGKMDGEKENENK